MVQDFKQKGLGDIILSWISTGDNLPVSADQLLHGIGEDRIQAIAEKAGISSRDAASQLTALLPAIIDKLIPDGKIPGGNLLAKGLEILKGQRPTEGLILPSIGFGCIMITVYQKVCTGNVANAGLTGCDV